MSTRPLQAKGQGKGSQGANGPVSPYPADLANAGHGHSSHCGCCFHRRLTEEEIDFIVVRVLALWDPKDLDKLGF